MKKFHDFFKEEMKDTSILLRSVPSLTVSIFFLSVVCANLLANKELFNFKYLAMDCGFAFSWIMFLCMDIICKRWGPKASIKISVISLVMNLFVCAVFFLLSKTPGKWGEFYTTENIAVNDALNATFGGSWYVVLGSATASLVSSVVNSLLNFYIGKIVRKDGFLAFAARSYFSTLAGQFVDNLVFATIVSKFFFGWTWTQVFLCSGIAAFLELLAEILFSGIGYRVLKKWEEDDVGREYLDYLKAREK